MRKFMLITGIWLVVLLTISFFLTQVISFKNDKWLADRHILNKTQNTIEKQFYVGENFSIVFSAQGSIWVKEKIKKIRQFENEFSDWGVQIRSPAKSKTAILDGESIYFYKYEVAYDKGLLKTLTEWKKHIQDSPYAGQIISKDNTVWQSVIPVPRSMNRIQAYTYIKQVLNVYETDLLQLGIQANIIGATGAYALTDIRANHDMLILGGLSLFLLFVSVLAFTQNMYISIWLFLTMATSAMLPMIALHWAGYIINSLHLILPILIMTITMADGLHIWFDYCQRKSVSGTIKKMAVPCLLTSVTTLGGVVIFYGDILAPLHSIAVVGTLCILLAYGCIMLSNYIFLKYFGYIANKTAPPKIQILRIFPVKYYVAFMTIFVIIGGIGLGFIQSRSTFLDVFFKKEDAFYINIEKVNKALNGVQRVNVLLVKKGVEPFKDYSVFKEVLKIKKHLLALDSVQAVNGYNDAIGIVHKSFNGAEKYPTDTNTLSQEIFFAELSRSENERSILETWVNFDYTQSRIEIVLPLLNNKDLASTMESIDTILTASNFDSVQWSGTTVLFYEIGKLIVSSHVKGILGTLGIVFICLWIVYGRSIALRASVIGALPFVSILGVISLAGISLDYSTVILVSLGMGLAIDDSIHTANYINSVKNKSKEDYINRVGRVILITGFSLSLGYVVLFMSDIALLNSFGVIMPLSQMMASLFTVSAGILWLHAIGKHK